jgi:hypothetical protein
MPEMTAVRATSLPSHPPSIARAANSDASVREC